MGRHSQSRPRAGRRGWARLADAATQRPFTLALALVLPIPGTLATVLGDDVSQALSNIAAGVVSRGMGVAMAVGGLLTLIGLARGKSLAESTGLVLMAAGCGIYGLGVLAGLGLAGTVAGPIAIAVAAGCVLRALSLASTARSVSTNER